MLRPDPHRKPGKKPGRKNYSDEEKREAVVRYMLVGSFRRTAEQLGIHHTTLLEWSKTEWWKKTREAVEAEARNSPIAQNLRMRIDNIIGRMVSRLESPGVVESLNARELGFNIRELRRAQAFDKSDAPIEEIGENADPREIDALLRECVKELKESEGFGESGRKLSDLPSMRELMRQIELEDQEDEEGADELRPS